ncbi:MAG: oxidoreductase [Spirochaetae bacterium HGW-Spirochaetae-9]|nr:MAG: oxidoreductase [Spirochaetae bacterium HGW-Spirochaetae-9]
MEKIRFGLYGYGKVAQLHAKALAASANATLVSVCGRNADKAAAFAKSWGIEARSSAAEMASRDKVKVVIVTTPHPLHAAHAIECLEAGLNVIVEKPMALKVADCDAMIAAARSRNLSLGVISQRRWYPSTMRIKRAIEEGDLGIPLLGQATILGWRDEAYYNSDPWRGTWEHEGGGVIVNQAPHQLDLLSWFMGPVAGVSGSWINVNHPYINVDDSAVATIHFSNGGLGSIFVSNSQKPGIYAKVYIHGSSGASAGVQTDGGAMFIAGMSGVLEPPYNDLWTIPGQEKLLEGWKLEDAEYFSRIEPTWHFFSLQIDDFAAALAEGRKPAVTGEDGREAVKIIEGIYRSAQSGCSVNY